MSKQNTPVPGADIDTPGVVGDGRQIQFASVDGVVQANIEAAFLATRSALRTLTLIVGNCDLNDRQRRLAAETGGALNDASTEILEQLTKWSES